MQAAQIEQELMKHASRVKKAKTFFFIVDLKLSLHHTINSATALQILSPSWRKLKNLDNLPAFYIKAVLVNLKQ